MGAFLTTEIGSGDQILVDSNGAIHLAATREGLLVDPVYTGKALAGLISLQRRGAFTDGEVLFVHTGGTPALFAR